MPDRIASTRPVLSAGIIWSKLVSCQASFTPSVFARASPRSTSKPVSWPVSGFLNSIGG